MCLVDEEKSKWSNMTFRNKMRVLNKNITIEPMLAIYTISNVIAVLAAQNFHLEKACYVNLGYSVEVCSALTARRTENYTKEETQVQQLVAEMTIWRTFVQSSIPGFLIIFLGSWSDRRLRRKPFMLMPIFGEFLSCTSLIVCTYFFYQLPMEVSGFLECFFPALTGGWVTMNMAIFSYLADVSSVENRTLRIGIVNVFATAAVAIGLVLSGLLFQLIGFYGAFLISAALYIAGIAFGFVNVKEANAVSTITRNDLDGSDQQCNKNLQVETPVTGKMLMFLKDFFDFQHIRDAFAVVYVVGPNDRRKRVMLLIVTLISLIGPMYGEMTVIYLFMRYRFNWDEVQFSLFSTYSVITHLIGTSFSVGVFSHLLKIDDALIGVISCISKILAGFMYAFAQTEWQVYLAPLVDIVNGTSFIAMRSIASKLVPPEELGKLNSLYGACEALTPLLYGPMYAFVYAHTMDTMPGAFFILGGALTVPAVVIFAWMYTQHRGDRLRTQESRKSSMAEDMLKSLRVDHLAVTPSILNTSENHQQEMEVNGGQVNFAFQEESNTSKD